MDSAGPCGDWYGPIASAQRDTITTRTGRVCGHGDQTDEGVRESGGPEKFCTGR